MANITTTEVADAMPQFWAARAIGALSANLVMANLINRDASAEIAQAGDTINIVKRGAITVKDKSANTAVVPDAPSNTKIPVVLNKHKYVSWHLEDNASAKAIADAVNYVQDGMVAIAEAIETDLLELHASIANEVGTAGTDIDDTTILQARLQLNLQKCPMMGRNMIISPKDEIALLALDKFTSAEKRADGGNALTEAELGRIYGFNCYMSQLVDVTAGTPDTTHNIAFHRDAFVLAMRGLPLPAPGSGAIGSVIVDPRTGITLRYTRQWDADALATKHVIDVLYGIAAVDEDRLAVEVLG
jgi:N4-gp56 family major capsid protein